MTTNILIVVISLVTFVTDINAIRFGRVLPPEVGPEALAGVETLLFKQILDHYNSTYSYWDQRYFVNTNHWSQQPNAPVFLMVGGEGEASVNWMNSGQWAFWAYRYGALMFQLEHRFYGESHPTSDTSTENLKLLTSQQALSDAAYFIYSMNQKYNLTTSNKWILFGGSYPGNLVAWARLYFPDLVYGGISSSGPLMAKVNFFEYDDVVYQSLETISSGCGRAVNTAVRSIQNLWTTSNGQRTLASKFSICSGFNVASSFDRAQFIESVTGVISGAVQYNTDSNPKGIKYVCGYMNDATVANPLDRLAKLYKNSSTSCVYGSYAGAVNYYQQTAWTDTPVNSGSRQWIFQTCNEFGYYQTSLNKSALLSDTVPLAFFTQLCTDVFGSQYNPRQLDNSVASTNAIYQGTDITVTRVVFVQNSLDPWHVLGMVNRPTSESPLIFINGTSHCQDMNSPLSSDSKSLKNARSYIQAYLDTWLQ